MNRITILFLFFSLSTAAQDSITVSGRIIDSDSRTPLRGAVVRLELAPSHQLVCATVCDSLGNFAFKVSRTIATAQLHYTKPGFKTGLWLLPTLGKDVHLSISRPLSLVRQLKEVEVQSGVAPVTIRGDTLEFSTAYFRAQPNAVLKDLLKKIPGISIDQHGAITAYGKPVTRIMIEGTEYFANQTGLALQHLPADLFDKVQVMDTRTKQEAKLQVEKDGQDKTINLVLKPNKRKIKFGEADAGYGTAERYAASVSMNCFDMPRRVTLLGTAGNINRGSSKASDISAGTTGPGILQLLTTGINLVDSLNKRTKLSSSYTFSKGRLPLVTQSGRHRLIDDYRLSTSTEQRTISEGNKLSIEGDMRLDALTDLSLKLLLNVDRNNSGRNTQERTTRPDGLEVRESFIEEEIKSRGHGLVLLGTATRKLNKRGRSIGLHVSVSHNNHIQKGNNNFRLYYRDSSWNFGRMLQQQLNNEEMGSGLTLKATLVEPLSATAKLTFSYGIDYNAMLSTRLVSTITPTAIIDYVDMDSSLSNEFRSTTVVHQPQVSLNYTSKGKRLRAFVGGALLLSTLDNYSWFSGRSTRYQQTNAAPNSRIIFRLKKQGEISLIYNGSLRQPSIDQLQPLRVNTSPALLIVGNPELRPSFTHSFQLTHQCFSAKGRGITSSIAWLPVTNGFSTQTRILDGGVQESKVINVKGNYGYHARLDYFWKPRGETGWQFKTGLQINGGKNIILASHQGMANDPATASNVAQKFGIAQFVNVDYSFSGQYEFNFSFLPSLNRMQFRSPSNGRQLQYYQHLASLSSTYWFRPNLYLDNELLHTFSGLTSPGFRRGGLLWNAAIGLEFLESRCLTLKATAFDLLGQNLSVRRNQSDYFVEDFRSNVLERYLMLSLIYRIKPVK